MSFYRELKRRNVFRVGAAYVVAAWLLIQVAETIFPLFGFGDTPARIVVIVLAIGFVPVLVVAWAFELTPEGLKRDSEVDPTRSIAPKTGQKLDRIIMAVLAIALGYFTFDKFVLDPQRDIDITESATKAGVEQAREEARLNMFDEKSVAILPFVNRSGEKEDQYFADGMHDELLTRLSRVSELKVISRTSVMKFRESEKTIPEIAQELSVATIVEGGVQRSGNQVRINIQLINAHTDEHIWAEIYDRELTAENLFAIQSEISAAIADSLKATLSPEERSRVFELPTSNLEAYNHFLRGRQAMALRTKEGLSQARSEFEQAVELDPDFALAWVGVSDTVHLLFEYGQLDRIAHLELHKQAVDRALVLNDQLGEAYASLGFYYVDTGEFDKAEIALVRAIELNPNYAQAYHWYANILRGEERKEKRLSLLYKAAQLDPLSSVIQINIAGELLTLGRTEEARQAAQRLIRTDPDFPSSYTFLGTVEQDYGHLAEAARLYSKAMKLDPGNVSTLESAAQTYVAMRAYDNADLAIEAIETQVGKGSEPGERARWRVLIAQSRPLDAIAILDSFPADWKALPVMKYAYMYTWIFAGEFKKARDYLYEIRPSISDRDHWQQEFADRDDTDCMYAGILINSGDQVLGQEFLDFSIRNLQSAYDKSNPSTGTAFAMLECYLIDGAYQQALDFLDEATSQGQLLGGWWLLAEKPWWDPIKDDPRYIALADRIETSIAEQRQIYLAADTSEGTPH